MAGKASFLQQLTSRLAFCLHPLLFHICRYYFFYIYPNRLLFCQFFLHVCMICICIYSTITCFPFLRLLSSRLFLILHSTFISDFPFSPPVCFSFLFLRLPFVCLLISSIFFCPTLFSIIFYYIFFLLFLLLHFFHSCSLSLHIAILR